jgi:hypothetical protein
LKRTSADVLADSPLPPSVPLRISSAFARHPRTGERIMRNLAAAADRLIVANTSEFVDGELRRC